MLLREQELEDKVRDLEDMNAALRVLLKKRDDDKIEVEEKIQLNVKELGTMISQIICVKDHPCVCQKSQNRDRKQQGQLLTLPF